MRHKIRHFFASDDEFRIRVTPGADPEDPTPVYVVLRVRGGTTRPPSLRARPALKRRVDAVLSFRRNNLGLDSESIGSTDNGAIEEIVVGLDPFVGPGRTVRFGFSIEIVQGGRRLGGMRSGAICSIRFSSRAHRYYRGCSPVGFKRHA